MRQLRGQTVQNAIGEGNLQRHHRRRDPLIVRTYLAILLAHQVAHVKQCGHRAETDDHREGHEQDTHKVQPAALGVVEIDRVLAVNGGLCVRAVVVKTHFFSLGGALGHPVHVPFHRRYFLCDKRGEQ